MGGPFRNSFQLLSLTCPVSAIFTLLRTQSGIETMPDNKTENIMFGVKTARSVTLAHIFCIGLYTVPLNQFRSQHPGNYYFVIFTSQSLTFAAYTE